MTPARRHAAPLPIATLAALPHAGRIGVAPCPGLRAGAGDAAVLAADLAAIRAWGAGPLVTLTEAEELRRLGLAGLGAAARAAGLAWHHLPIMDFGVPDAGFEAAWAGQGPALRAHLRGGGALLLHCRGGLGRSGTIAARLLVELGTPPAEAIARVRAARPGAIETAAQAAHLHALGPLEG